jgi:hypothetical protein
VETLRVERQGADGFRHFVGGVPVRCGDLIEALVGDEWVRGRYEAGDLSPASCDPAAFIHFDGHAVRLKENTPVRFPGP